MILEHLDPLEMMEELEDLVLLVPPVLLVLWLKAKRFQVLLDQLD